jgi:ankyrin repeat protein
MSKRFLVVSVLLAGLMQPIAAWPAADARLDPAPGEDRLAEGKENVVEPKDPSIGQITPLHKAVKRGDLEAVRRLLDQGAEVNAAIARRTLRWHRLETPLETAIRARQIEIARLLIERGANVNARNRKGETLLHLAVRINDPNLVKMLLAAGAHPTARSREELTPAHLARKLDRKSGKRKEIIALLREAEAKALKEEPPVTQVAPPAGPPE